MSFSNLGLSDQILAAIDKKGYKTPSPIQEQAIPAILLDQDVMAASQTGTGKTAGFTLPILEKLSKGQRSRGNQVRALILTPTRELAAQVHDSVMTYGKELKLRSGVVFGGVKINPQMMKLRGGVDILVATPGRLLDLYNKKAVKFSDLEILVLDEADRMLDMGFIRDIKKIISFLPKKRQNILFSATFSPEIRNLAKGIINNPVEISVTPRNTTVESIEHFLYPIDQKKKTSALIKLIKTEKWEQALVFSRTKRGANRITEKLTEKGISAVAIHGNKGQGARTRALASLKNKTVKILVATDIAARGIDIDQLPQVVNFDLPHVPEDYIHRIGRTGRAGATGRAVSFVSFDEFDQLRGIERLLKKTITRKEMESFTSSVPLPESVLDTRPIKPSRPKKNKASDTSRFQRKKTSTGAGKTARKKPFRRRKKVSGSISRRPS